MDATQIMMMPAGAGSTQASGLPAVATGGATAGLFGRILGQNILGLQGLSSLKQNANQPQPEVVLAPPTDSITALTHEFTEQEIPSTESDPAVVNQLAAYAQLAVLQINNLPIVQQQVVTSGAGPADVMPVAAADPALPKQEVALNVAATPSEFVGLQKEEQQMPPETIGHPEPAVAAKLVTLVQAGSGEKLQDAVPDAVTKPVQQREIGLTAGVENQVQKVQAIAQQVTERATEALQQYNIHLNTEPEKPVQRNNVSGQQVAQQATEAQPVAQEIAGTVKNTAAVVSQPVRFAQHPDVTAAAAGPEGQKNTASNQQEQGSLLMAKTPKGLVMQGEQIKPELVENVGTAFRLPEQHTVAMHAGLSQVAATDGTTTELIKNVPQDPVGRQVIDRLTSHEIKQGNDQISLKLSPENLGNLQLNMRMDDNRLKLEIIAETRGVRDALLQQADELKETLARQNIKVDSFNVTTGNGNQPQQQSADWRQMAEQRQYQPHYTSVRAKGGAVEGVETTMKYFVPQYQSTLDVRF